jgi:pimeloyl-ACP methyl ester carboxylesterase
VARSAARWPRITAPTLVVWGEQDVALGHELSEGLEGVVDAPFVLRYVPDAGHWVQQERPEVVNAALLEFLGDLAPAEARAPAGGSHTGSASA